MRKHYNITLFILLVTTFFSACKVDDIQPLNALTEENVITNEATAQAVLNNVYTKYRSGFYTAMSGFMIEFLGDGLANLYPSSYGSGDMDVNDVRDDNEFTTGYYTEFYQMINQANWLIALLEAGKAKGLSEVRRDAMISEAKVMRAMGHFNLLRLFGQFYDLNSTFGIVIRTKPAKGLDIAPRNTVRESYDAILEDLKFAKQHGPAGTPHWVASRTTAAAWLAKVYLNMGDYPNAATEALAVIQNSDGYYLEDHYQDIFNKRFDSRETFFSPFADGVNETNYSTQIALSSYSDYYETIADADVPGPGDLAGAGSGYDPRFSFIYADNTAGINTNGKFPFRFSGSSGASGSTLYPLRMAEIYLIYAEAKARIDADVSAEAVARVNEIRNRAGDVLLPIAPSTKQELLMAIYDEKILELAGENGEHWFDMVRYDRLGDISIAERKPTISQVNKLIMPIPRAAMAGNKLLVQNP